MPEVGCRRFRSHPKSGAVAVADTQGSPGPQGGAAFAALPKSPSASAASHANTAHAATFWASAAGSILSSVSSAAWCRSAAVNYT